MATAPLALARSHPFDPPCPRAAPTAGRLVSFDSAVQGRCQKIQAICNGIPTTSAMQAIEIAMKDTLVQEQWETMEKTMPEALGTMKIAAQCNRR